MRPRQSQDDKSAIHPAARSRFIVVFAVLIGAAALISGNATVAFGSASSPPSVAVSGSVVLGGSPGTPAANPRTGTVYVPIQCTTSFCAPNTPGHVVDVINAATCNAHITSGCRVVATAQVGSAPLAAVVAEQTDTVLRDERQRRDHFGP